MGEVIQTNVTADLNPSKTIATSMQIYFVIVVLGWIAYFYISVRKQNIYACRNRDERTQTPSAVQTSNTSFQWIRHVLNVSDQELFEQCGLDTLFFLRFLKLGQKLAACGIVLSAALFPLYATGTNPSENKRTNIDPLERITMSNLDVKEQRLWASVVAMYCISFYGMYLMINEYRVYTKYRHQFLSLNGVQQYTILISDVPTELRTNQTLKYYMDYLFPDDVERVSVAIECGELENLTTQRAKIRNKLEHNLAKSGITGTRPLISTSMCCGGAKIDAIDHYQNELNYLNTQVTEEFDAIVKEQEELANQTFALGFEDSVFGGGENGNDEMYVPPPKNSLHFPQGIMRSSAFVEFSSLQTTQIAQQILQSENPIEMTVSAAPHPDDVVWANIGLSKHVKDSWRLISTALSTAIVLFWTIPTGIVVSFSTAESLQKNLSMKRTFEEHPWLIEFVKQLSPIGLAVMSALAPIIFRILSQREGHPSGTEVNSSLFTKLVCFQAFQIFFVSVIAGTVFESLTKIADDPQSIVGFLGTSIPSRSTVFITYIIVQTGLQLTLELLRVVPVVIGQIYKTFAPQLTKRERTSPWFGLKRASLPGEFDQTGCLPEYYLTTLLIFTFTPIAPLLCYFAFFFLFLSEIVYRRQVLFVYDPSMYSMGVFWPRLHTYLVGAMILAQVTFLGLISLKQNAGTITASVILPFLSGLYLKYVNSTYPLSASNLPISLCAPIDRKRTKASEIKDASFNQPSLNDVKPIEPDYLELSDKRHDFEQSNHVKSPVEDGGVNGDDGAKNKSYGFML